MKMTETIHRYDDRTAGAWDAFIKAMDSGEQFECDEGMYDYWLGVLPPRFMGKYVSWPDGQQVLAGFGFAEGADYITAFWKVGERFFGRRTNIMARG
jgi:hypothetical protein